MATRRYTKRYSTYKKRSGDSYTYEEFTKEQIDIERSCYDYDDYNDFEADSFNDYMDSGDW